MDNERRIDKNGLSGRELGRDRGGVQTQTGDGSFAIEIGYTHPGKNH